MSNPETLEPVEQTPLEQLGIHHPREILLGAYERWEKTESARILDDPIALMSCRGVAGQIISPKHIEFAKKIETIHPPEERFIRHARYNTWKRIDERKHSAEIVTGWDDRKLIVAPAIGIKNGQPEEFAFMLPGRGIIYDENEEDRLLQIIEEQAMKIPPHIEDLADEDILKTLRHITVVISDNDRIH